VCACACVCVRVRACACAFRVLTGQALLSTHLKLTVGCDPPSSVTIKTRTHSSLKACSKK
jgi:hypothetical protein